MPRSSPKHFELSDWSVISISGPDRANYLHSFCTNDIKSLKSGAGCEAFITTIKGRILGHVLVFAGDESLTLVAVPQASAVIIPHLQKYLLGAEAEIVDQSGQKVVLCLNRPAAELLQAGAKGPPVTFTGCVTPDENWLSAASELGLTGGDTCEPAPVPSRPGEHLPAQGVLQSQLACTEILPEYGWLLIGPASASEAIYNRLASFGVQPGDAQEFDALRIAAGFPWHGRDLSDENIAQEAGRTDQAISFKKGCYLGQEPIARLDALGHTNKELRQLVIDTLRPPAAGTSVLLNGAEVGKVTSSAITSDPEKCVALAMLKTVATEPGTAVQVASDSGETLHGQVNSLMS